MNRTVAEIGATLGASVLVVVGVLTVGGNLQAAPAPVPAYVTQRPGCLDTPVFPVDGSGLNGQARLCIVDEGVRPSADVDGLTPSTAYVTWFAYFDRPQGCQKGNCTLVDLRGDAAAGVSGRMDGIVADGLRKAQFRGDFRDLRTSGGSDALIFVFERGPVAPGDAHDRARKLLTVQVPGLDLPEAHLGVGGGRLVAHAIFRLP